jgi:formylmethanofuran dehydrogenase subunit A
VAEYLIKNGFVFDPVLGIRGDKADVAIKDGKIVETSAVKNPKVIDATR